MLDHDIREAQSGDIPFIVHEWVQEMRRAPASKGVSDARYFPGQRGLVLAILARSQTAVACDPKDPSHVFGFLTRQGSVLHWVYVKSVYHGLGLARSLYTRTFLSGFSDGERPPIACSQLSGAFASALAMAHGRCRPRRSYSDEENARAERIARTMTKYNLEPDPYVLHRAAP